MCGTLNDLQIDCLECPTHPIPESLTSVSPQSLKQSFLFYTWQCIYVNASLPSHPTLAFLHVHMPLLYVCLSIPAWQISSSVPFFYITYIYVLIYDTCFSHFILYDKL